MKGVAMLSLLAILGTGLALCAADGIAICRHPVRRPPTVHSRRLTQLRSPRPLTSLRRQA
jgi:hypothetical protein